MKNMDASYWQQRYETGSTGWDIGHISTPLQHFFDTLIDPNISILIPGCGNAYEASYLHKKGFSNVFILDYAEHPLRDFASKNPEFPAGHLIHQDFFMHEGQYDLIIEQTFFCALNPGLRKAYVEKMQSLLKPGGQLCGLLFNCQFENEGPPFGGEEEEYRQYFREKFIIDSMEPCANSIQPRAGKELFIRLRKP